MPIVFYCTVSVPICNNILPFQGQKRSLVDCAILDRSSIISLRHQPKYMALIAEAPLNLCQQRFFWSCSKENAGGFYCNKFAVFLTVVE